MLPHLSLPIPTRVTDLPGWLDSPSKSICQWREVEGSDANANEADVFLE
jgi:hypothetical protein